MKNVFFFIGISLCTISFGQDLVINKKIEEGTIICKFKKYEPEKEKYVRSSIQFIGDDSKEVYDIYDTYSIGEYIADICEDEYKLLQYAIENKDEMLKIFDNKHMGRVESPNNNIWEGADFFYTESRDIVIAFKANIEIVVVKSFCREFNNPLYLTMTRRHCEFEDDLKLPLGLVSHVISLNKLNKREACKQNLIKAKINSLPIIYCE